MIKDRIEIDKSLIPYKFNIMLNSNNYGMEIRYNAEADLFTIGLYDSEDNIICTEPIIYGAELFQQHYQAGVYPTMRIIPTDESGKNTAVTWDNFNDTVFLVIENTGGDDE